MSKVEKNAKKSSERDRGEVQCYFCSLSYRNDRILGHLVAKHKHELTVKMDPECRATAIRIKLPMMFYHTMGVVNKSTADKDKMFCACLICGKGRYAGGKGDVGDFIKIHRSSDCVKQWDSVADLFGELPEGVKLESLPAPPVVPEDPTYLKQQVKELNAKIHQQDRRITMLLEHNKTLQESDDGFRQQRTALQNEIKQLKQQLSETQAIPAPPRSRTVSVDSNGEPEPEPEPQPPTLIVVPTEPEPRAPTLIVVPTEPEPQPDFATMPVATVRPKIVRKIAAAVRAEEEKAQQNLLLETQAADKPKDPNEGRDGYFLVKSGKWLRKITGAMPRPTTTLLAVKPPPVVLKSPMLTLNAEQLIAQLESEEDEQEENSE